MFGWIYSNNYDNDASCGFDTAVQDSNQNKNYVVGDTLSKYCHCVPEWTQGVYFEPAATLYATILVVVGYLIISRARPLIILVVKSVFKSWFKFSSVVIKHAVDKFHLLPSHLQEWIQSELNAEFPEMPSIGSRIVKTKVDFFKSSLWKAWLNLSKQIAPSLKQNLTVEGWNMMEKLMNGGFRQDEDNKKCDETQEARPISPYSNINASAKFIEWLEDLVEEDLSKVLDILHAGAKKEHDNAERDDTFILLILQLFLAISVLIDYFGVQTWPSGSDWQCRWACFAAVVMFEIKTRELFLGLHSPETRLLCV